MSGWHIVADLDRTLPKAERLRDAPPAVEVASAAELLAETLRLADDPRVTRIQIERGSIRPE